ncbi:MAG TPA: trigger factor [Parcubacteria group bacterium]|jgi:trigger factor|nr:trigger factor [Parcubacteria group bacterium]
MSKKHYKDIKLSPLPERELEIIGSINAEKMSLMREKALKKLKEKIELPGFRKGNAPDSLVAQKVGEGSILEEAAEIALTEEYPNILEEHKIDAIGRPEITITKIGVGSDMEFKIKTALMPEVKLADYKKIAGKVLSKKAEDVSATDKDVEDVIQNIRENLAHEKVHAEAGGGHEHNHRKIEDSDLPEVNDEFAKMLGNFENLEEMKKKIRENLSKEKEMKAKDKKRTEILEKIIEESTIDLPKIIVDGEMEKMLAQFKDDIAKSGISYEDYLKHIKKTEDDLRLEWKDASVKRAKSQVVLNTIAKDGGIAPKEDEVKKEMENILSHYKDADRFRVRMYVETFLTNELVFQFLEKE